jgi:putative membrane protein
MTPAWRHAFALPVLVLAACSQKTADNAANATQNAVNATENAFSNAANVTGNAIDNASLALTPTPSPQDFVDKAAKSDAFEIAAAKIAATNASATAVRDFAKMMIEAHGKSTASIKKAAAGLSPAVTPDATLTDSQNDRLADLRKLTGGVFDKKYVDDQIDAHEDALALMRKYAADGEAPALKSAAQEIVPVVEAHLKRAKELKTD